MRSSASLRATIRTSSDPSAVCAATDDDTATEPTSSNQHRHPNTCHTATSVPTPSGRGHDPSSPATRSPRRPATRHLPRPHGSCPERADGATPQPRPHTAGVAAWRAPQAIGILNRRASTVGDKTVNNTTARAAGQTFSGSDAPSENSDAHEVAPFGADRTSIAVERPRDPPKGAPKSPPRKRIASKGPGKTPTFNGNPDPTRRHNHTPRTPTTTIATRLDQSAEHECRHTTTARDLSRPRKPRST